MRMKEDIVNFFINDETEYSFSIQMLELSRNTTLETKELFDESALLFHKIIIKIADKIQDTKPIHMTLSQKLKQYIDQNALVFSCSNHYLFTFILNNLFDFPYTLFPCESVLYAFAVT